VVLRSRYHQACIALARRRGDVVLPEGFLLPFAGFFLYFPQRRNMVPKQRALIDHVRQWQAPLGACG
jgi:DNA-binding transcriptional LysR family regulator